MAYSTPIASVYSGTNSGGTTSAGIDTTGADLIVVAVAYYTGAAAPTLSDSYSNTWTPATEWVASGGPNIANQRLFHCHNPSVGVSHTFTTSGASSFSSLAAAAFSGSAASPLDQENGSGSGLQTGNVTPSEANELLLTMVTDSQSGNIATSIDSGFSVIGTPLPNSNGNYFGIGLAYLIETTAAAKNPTWSSGSSGKVGAAIATFKAASGGGGGVFSWANYYHRHVGGLGG